MLIFGGYLSTNTSAGSASENTAYLRGLCHHIIVKPASEDTTYDITITNPAGVIIYHRRSETGVLSELTKIPVLGIYTISILNSTKDENFIIQTICEE